MERVILLEGGFGESLISKKDIPSISFNLCHGKSEQVCPSGPTPNNHISIYGTF